MFLSQKLNLNKSQLELDFVDIDLNTDIPLFLDSTLIKKCNSGLSIAANNTLNDFFKYLIGLLKNNYEEQAQNICMPLGEVNETYLGLSKGKPKGRGIGKFGALAIFERIKNSEALKTGVLEDIEDLRIFVDKIDKDKISDMITNIIKYHLLKYTQDQCELYNIPLVNAPSGYYWNENKHIWENNFLKRLIIDEKPILLVPKNIISYCNNYTPQQYKQHFILNFLQRENIENHTSLVKKRKNDELYVTKKSIIEHEPKMDKKYFLDFTIKHPEIFENFKSIKDKTNILNEELNQSVNKREVCDYLISELNSIKVGNEHASKFHNLMLGIFELLGYPDLSNPIKENEIHEGRKRIDIVFSNTSQSGFFTVFIEKIKMSCPQLIIECKNYTDDLQNPELDQLAGRFSIRRGQIGIISCRSLENRTLFIKRCADTYSDGHGFIIPLTDDEIVKCLKSDDPHDEFLSTLQLVSDEILRNV